MEHPGTESTWTSRRSLTLGMPQLGGCGLSESWLQKACGEVHWRGLAANLGRPAEGWLDTTGRRVYAAFGIVRLTGGRLALAREGQRLRLESRLCSLGRSQAWSRHRLQVQDGCIGQLEMLSVFVGRGEDGSNRSVRRVAMRQPSPVAAHRGAQVLADRARAWRSALAADAASDAAAPTVRFMPCPRGDFNGAGLVYFASFTTWADRALFGWGLLPAEMQVVERECLFLGNLDPGWEVELSLAGQTPVPGGHRLELRVRCPRQDRLLAVLRTVAGSPAAGDRP